MVDFFAGFKGIGGGIVTTLKYTLYALPFAILIIFIIIHFKNKALYKYKVRIYRIREGETHKELNYKGGYIMRKNSAPFFRIKTGKWWWKHIDLIKTPNPAYIDEEDRVYYKQIDVDTFVQIKRRFEKGEVVLTPVEPEVKYGAILSIQRIKEALRLESTWKKLLPYIGLVLLAVTFIIAYALLMDKCSG